MKSEINKKLRSKLVEVVGEKDFSKNKYKVVYFFVLCRKIIESEKIKNSFIKSINFFTDWLVHVQLDRSSATWLHKEIEKQRKERFDSYFAQTNIAFQLITLEGLRKSISEFFIYLNIENNLTTSEMWNNFMDVIYDEIVDYPVKRFEFEKVEVGSFRFISKNGKNISYELKQVGQKPSIGVFSYDQE